MTIRLDRRRGREKGHFFTAVVDRSGESTILNRLADVIFIDAVKSYFSDASGGPRGWFAALKDRHIGASISLIHRELQKPWTVASLASAVGMSRSAFALRFSVLLGESQIEYLARLRIAAACNLLETSGFSIAKIAGRVGYESDVAFSRVFKRHVGISPIEYRRERHRQTKRPRARRRSSGEHRPSRPGLARPIATNATTDESRYPSAARAWLDRARTDPKQCRCCLGAHRRSNKFQRRCVKTFAEKRQSRPGGSTSNG